ncbi:uncharacterized protein EKO05_0006114 [Ascochyta rabiei]|uniref:Substrate-specific transmembrane transporter n=1 Tax=Didymella rabiei TaxID=5454 RepID=A0A163MJH7_DIDRA|nr:uncharacterized protein EKO05_0006114 [Ascochyta rabiei]KZM28773.1 substrate-specific transmembrane transporter [Ascochyta rabiei]UPX15673.1 hypothetical protein EKO05_0006114 [Ascochyta rabiei]
MLMALMGAIMFFHKSPRWLVKMGRKAEGRYVLARLPGDTGIYKKKAETEFQKIVLSCELERSDFRKQGYFDMLFGIDSGKLQTDRRVQLVIWIQIMQKRVGIAAIPVFAPTIFGISGISPAKRQ